LTTKFYSSKNNAQRAAKKSAHGYYEIKHRNGQGWYVHRPDAAAPVETDADEAVAIGVVEPAQEPEPRVHTFGDTGTAYDSSQCRDDIHDGDVLVVAPEGVVGILVGAWPVAVTQEAGHFHTAKDGWDWSAVQKIAHSSETVDYTASHTLALVEAAKLETPKLADDSSRVPVEAEDDAGLLMQLRAYVPAAQATTLAARVAAVVGNPVAVHNTLTGNQVGDYVQAPAKAAKAKGDGSKSAMLAAIIDLCVRPEGATSDQLYAGTPTTSTKGVVWIDYIRLAEKQGYSFRKELDAASRKVTYFLTAKAAA
jgi:hypothetical protein